MVSKGYNHSFIWKNWPAAVFRTVALLPLAKGAAFASCAFRRGLGHVARTGLRLSYPPVFPIGAEA